MADTCIPHILTEKDVYEIRNEWLRSVDLWPGVTDEDYIKESYWQRGVAEMAEKIVKKINGDEDA